MIPPILCVVACCTEVTLVFDQLCVPGRCFSGVSQRAAQTGVNEAKAQEASIRLLVCSIRRRSMTMNMNMTLSRVVFAPVQRTMLGGKASFGWSLSKRTFIGTTTCNMNYKVAIVGSGPSGCYTAKYLKAAWDKLESNSNCHQTHEIDVLERLPTPYGLVRYGVAPDHPEVKNVQDDFDALFANNNDKNDNNTSNSSTTTIDYVGHVEVGRDVSLDTLRHRYHAVVVATGCQSDRRLGLPHEDAFTNILSAREFVAWYNGHPDFEAVRM